MFVFNKFTLQDAEKYFEIPSFFLHYSLGCKDIYIR